MMHDGPSLFALPELLPNTARLLVDEDSNTVFLLSFQGPELASSSLSFRLTPSAMRVFVALLHAYPQFCSYRTLFVSLYPLSQEQEANRVWEYTLAHRPIRRALLALLPTLRGLGLRAVSLRGRGYVLATDVVDTCLRGSHPK